MIDDEQKEYATFSIDKEKCELEIQKFELSADPTNEGEMLESEKKKEEFANLMAVVESKFESLESQ